MLFRPFAPVRVRKLTNNCLLIVSLGYLDIWSRTSLRSTRLFSLANFDLFDIAYVGYCSERCWEIWTQHQHHSRRQTLFSMPASNGQQQPQFRMVAELSRPPRLGSLIPATTGPLGVTPPGTPRVPGRQSSRPIPTGGTTRRDRAERHASREQDRRERDEPIASESFVERRVHDGHQAPKR